MAMRNTMRTNSLVQRDMTLAAPITKNPSRKPSYESTAGSGNLGDTEKMDVKKHDLPDYAEKGK